MVGGSVRRRDKRGGEMVRGRKGEEEGWKGV